MLFSCMVDALTLYQISKKSYRKILEECSRMLLLGPEMILLGLKITHFTTTSVMFFYYECHNLIDFQTDAMKGAWDKSKCPHFGPGFGHLGPESLTLYTILIKSKDPLQR